MIPRLVPLALLLAFVPQLVRAADRPNVVLIITDDQGYGDIAAHGNTIIKTPNLDALYADSVRLTDYHVDPTCSPTRSALMSGRYSSQTGVWHTIMGRSMMHPDEYTLAEMFRDNGYRTGFFGKWHLGDNAPLRPEDQGFTHVFRHGGGGVGQTPDYFGNDYFSDTYFDLQRDKQWLPQDGYCTDVWFRGASEFVTAESDEPFFCYLATNAPHGPYNVAKEYSDPYVAQGVPQQQANFWGMITNIDENVGGFRKLLAEKGLAENTIFIFTTDNGTAAGAQGRKGFNAGMRGQKGSEYDGGHRVPFLVKWPQGGIGGGRDVDVLSAHVDVMPTLAQLCGFELDPPNPLAGRSLALLLLDQPGIDWPTRTLTVHSQRIETPEKWRKSAVMTDRWRLVNGRELYDIEADPGQEKDVAAENPEVVGQLREEYDAWWKTIGERFDDTVDIALGTKAENPAHLTCHDWHTDDGPVPWHQNAIRNDQVANGYWAVEVVEDGNYTVTLRNRPEQENHPLNAKKARIRFTISSGEDSEYQTGREMTVDAGATSVTFEKVRLRPGTGKLETWIEGNDDKTRGAYFVEIEKP